MSKTKSKTIFFTLYFLGLMLWSVFFAVPALAHGDEDHGAEKPKTETTDKGTVSHTTRVGDLEVMLRHQSLVPDTAATARLFVTRFENNEAFTEVVTAIEIEAANGIVVPATVEKSATAGSFTVKIPALPEATYLIRAKLTHGGETDTATFSGIEIKPAPTASAETVSSWAQTALMLLAALLILGLFGGLIYFALRIEKSESVGEKETVSA